MLNIMNITVLSKIFKRVQECNFFSLIADTSPDIFGRDNLIIIIPYMNLKKIKSEERLIYCRIIDEKKTGENLFSEISAFLT